MSFAFQVIITLSSWAVSKDDAEMMRDDLPSNLSSMIQNPETLIPAEFSLLFPHFAPRPCADSPAARALCAPVNNRNIEQPFLFFADQSKPSKP
jgi:hypothetical protein